MFNCSDGSNIYPGFIELQLENEPFISQAVLLGDRRPFVAALIVAARQRIAEALRCEIANLSDEEIESALWSQIARVNGRLEVYEQIKKIAVLRDDFPPEVRSINQFQKVKVDRKMVAARYGQEIDVDLPAAPTGAGIESSGIDHGRGRRHRRRGGAAHGRGRHHGGDRRLRRRRRGES